MRKLSTTAVVFAIAAVITESPAGADAVSSGFLADSTTALQTGSTATVTFTEAGVAPGQTVTIAVNVTSSATTVCQNNGVVWLTTTSSATAGDTRQFTSASDGSVTGTNTYTVDPGVVTVTGLGCTVSTTRSLIAELSDLTTGATLTVVGQIVP